MKIRKGKISDLKELLKFLNETPELQSSKGEKTYTRAWVKDSLTDKDRNLVLIAEENNKIIGFLIAELWKKKKSSFFADIFVKPEYRKQGIATKLKDKYEKICKKLGLKTIVGLVLVTNKKMYKLMEKRGYKRGNKFYFYEKRLK